MKKGFTGKLFIITILLLMVCELYGQEKSRVFSFALYYPQKGIEIDEHYLDNSEQIFQIRKYLSISPKIDSIAIWSYASPEGPYKQNVWLAEERAKAAKNFILENMPEKTDLSEDKIKLRPVPENWDGLLKEAESAYPLENKEQVLRILKADIPDQAKKQALRDLDGGRSWWYLIRHHMDKLRMATWICVWVNPSVPEMEPVGPMKAEPLFDEAELLPKPEQRVVTPALTETGPKARRTFMVLKTNLLYDAATAVNFAIEVPVSDRFSVQYEHVCPWWTAGPNGKRYSMQILSLCGEARWWFAPRTRLASEKLVQRDALMGHFIGLYADGGKFDVQIGSKTGFGQSYYKGVGLSYGYSLPICKRLNMEFSVSLGYMMIDYQQYNPLPDWTMLIRDDDKAGRMHFFGPTKVKVSLAVPLLTRKGGKR